MGDSLTASEAVPGPLAFTADELAEWQEAADRAGRSLADFVARAVKDAIALERAQQVLVADRPNVTELT